jgi:hypothetical protein
MSIWRGCDFLDIMTGFLEGESVNFLNVIKYIVTEVDNIAPLICDARMLYKE